MHWEGEGYPAGDNLCSTASILLQSLFAICNNRFAQFSAVAERFFHGLAVGKNDFSQGRAL